MAARSGAGTGVVVGLVVFVLSTIFLLVLTIVFYSKASTAQEEKLAAEDNLSKYISRVELNTDQFKAIEAESGASESAMGHLLNQYRNVMGKVVGDPNASIADLNARLNTYTNNPNATYVDAMREQQQKLQAARAEADGAKQQLASAQNTIAERDEALRNADAAKDSEVQAVQNLIETYATDVANHSQDVFKTKQQMMQSLQDLENSFDSQVEVLEGNLDSLRTDLALKDSQLQVYQRIIADIRMNITTPEKLVDGHILDSPNTENQVFINRGRLDHIVMGMTFEIYDSAEQLSPDANGNLVRGKASLQVIKVGETTSTAKITRDSASRPVVRNDVIANAVYDPEKEFFFLVHGKFDMNGDGRPSAAETQQIKNLIGDWGGRLYDGSQIRGDLDFVVLGVQPNEPMSLPRNPTDAQVQRWVEQNQAFQTYNKILRDAMQASIPVLNQNRFLILIGHTNN